MISRVILKSFCRIFRAFLRVAACTDNCHPAIRSGETGAGTSGRHRLLSVPRSQTRSRRCGRHPRRIRQYPQREEIDKTGKSEPLAAKLADVIGHNRISINFAWTLVCGFLVMFMQVGFALVETGLCRAKNASHTMAMNMIIYCIGILGFWACGFAIQMGGVGGLPTLGGGQVLNREFSLSLFGKAFGLFGTKGFFLSGGAYDMAVFAIFLFQTVFMDTAATIPTGAMAERFKFSAFCIYGFLMAGLIYPLFANWVWGGGWLSALGANFGLGHGHVDFAGSSVVHMTGGVCALAGVLALGSADRQICQGRLRAPHSRTPYSDGNHRHTDPRLRLVRLQYRLHPGGDRSPHRRGCRQHHAGECRRGL